MGSDSERATQLSPFQNAEQQQNLKFQDHSPVVQWLRLRASTAGGLGWTLVRELISHMPCGMVKIFFLIPRKFSEISRNRVIWGMLMYFFQGELQASVSGPFSLYEIDTMPPGSLWILEVTYASFGDPFFQVT